MRAACDARVGARLLLLLVSRYTELPAAVNKELLLIQHATGAFSVRWPTIARPTLTLCSVPVTWQYPVGGVLYDASQQDKPIQFQQVI